MSVWRAVGSVIAGAFVTIVLGILTVLVLPFLGFASAEVVGSWVPIWVFAIPPALCATAGGATTGFLQRRNWKSGVLLGSLAAALGVMLFGVVVGLVFLVLLLGMTPAHGQATDLSKAALAMATLGGGVGFIAGAIFGGLGGIGGHIGRQELGL